MSNELIYEILTQFRPGFTPADGIAACRRMFLNTLCYEYESMSAPFSKDEIDSLTEMIWKYLQHPESAADFCIALEQSRDLLGRKVFSSKFANMFAKDFMAGYYGGYKPAQTVLHDDGFRDWQEECLISVLYCVQACKNCGFIVEPLELRQVVRLMFTNDPDVMWNSPVSPSPREQALLILISYLDHA